MPHDGQGENLRLIHKETRACSLSGALVKKTRDAADRRLRSTAYPQRELGAARRQALLKARLSAALPYVSQQAAKLLHLSCANMAVWGKAAANL